MASETNEGLDAIAKRLLIPSEDSDALNVAYNNGVRDTLTRVAELAFPVPRLDHGRQVVDDAFAAAVEAKVEAVVAVPKAGWDYVSSRVICRAVLEVAALASRESPAREPDWEGFVREMFGDDTDRGDWDAGEIQDVAEKHGVLIRTTVTEPCDPEHCVCAEVDAFPLECFRLAARSSGQEGRGV